MNINHCYLIDTFSLLFRAYYGNLYIKNGATKAILRILLELINNDQTKYIACIFDHPQLTFRHRLYNQYKANRNIIPNDLRIQIPIIKNIIKVLNIPIIEYAGYEAEDIIATISKIISKKNIETIIISFDKDLIQLIDDDKNIKVLNYQYSETPIDNKKTKEYFGVWPHQIIDLLALTGDSSDNIIGIKNIGIKGAQNLIEKYNSMNNILINKTNLKKTYRNGLEGSIKKIPLIKRLVTITNKLRLPINTNSLIYKNTSPKKLKEILKYYNFYDLEKKINDTNITNQSLPYMGSYHIAKNQKDIIFAVQKCETMCKMGIYIESTESNHNKEAITGIGISWTSNEGMYIPILNNQILSNQTNNSYIKYFNNNIFTNQVYSDDLKIQNVLETLSPLLNNHLILKSGHNLKKIIKILKTYHHNLNGIGNDSMLLGYIVDPTDLNTLDHLVFKYLKRQLSYSNNLIQNIYKQNTNSSHTAKNIIEKADLSLQLCIFLEKIINNPFLSNIYKQIDLPLVEVLAQMEFTGITINACILNTLSKQVNNKLSILKRNITEQAGENFNINSSKELSQILYNKLNLPILKKTQKKKIPATNETTLSKLAQQHNSKLAEMILYYRQIQKLLSTYISIIPNIINPSTNRLHTQLHQTIVASGRLSSSDPNLQNIPIRTNDGQIIRSAFTTQPGWIILDADYSQIELRIVASLAKDPILLKAFNSGEDIHKRTASEIMDLPIEKISPQQRYMAKIINFSILYGQGAITLASKLNISIQEAKYFIKKYFERMPKVLEWIQYTKSKAIHDGLVRTYWGRIRYIPNLHSSDENLKSSAIREAINTVVQGTAADIMRHAMVLLYKEFINNKLNANILLQIHDELLIEAKYSDVPTLYKIIINIMEKADKLLPLDVKLITNIHIGRNWRDCK